MTCETPPDATCQANTAISYADTGTCSGGVCNYETTQTDCRPAGNCENGACIAITEIKVVINEIYYNPPTSQGDDLDYEFLELYNAGATVNLEGWQFTSGIEHTFESYTFENGTYLILVSHTENYTTLSVPVIEWNLSNLHNDGETLTLVNAAQAEMDSVTYDKTASSGWYTAANGQGKSLELGDPWSDNSDPANWHASEAEHGTPGTANSD
jgi:hypothetical protein